MRRKRLGAGEARLAESAGKSDRSDGGGKEGSGLVHGKREL